MTTKKSQIFGQVEIGGNLTSAVNCEAGDSSFEAAPPPKLASQALSHKLKCKKNENFIRGYDTNRIISAYSGCSIKIYV